VRIRFEHLDSTCRLWLEIKQSAGERGSDSEHLTYFNRPSLE
jgi:hypothetical protein